VGDVFFYIITEQKTHCYETYQVLALDAIVSHGLESVVSVTHGLDGALWWGKIFHTYSDQL
jgi:hypothetical protein